MQSYTVLMSNELTKYVCIHSYIHIYIHIHMYVYEYTYELTKYMYIFIVDMYKFYYKHKDLASISIQINHCLLFLKKPYCIR